MDVLSLLLSRLRNETHIQFMYDVAAELQKAVYAPVRELLGSVLTQFNECVALEDAANAKIRKSAYTEQITQLDQFRDGLHHALGILLGAYLKSLDPEKAEAARQLKIVFDNYGSIARDSLLQETGVVRDLVQDLEAGTNFIEILEIDPVIHSLGAANNELISLISLRDNENTDKAAIAKAKLAREATDAVYRQIITVLQAALITAAPALKALVTDFIAHLNTIIARYRKNLSSGKKSSSSSGGDDGDDGEIVEEVIVVKE
jgi:hypothetical protein